MSRPSRTRRIFKWTGVGLSLLMLGAWVLSFWWWSRACVNDALYFSYSNRGVWIDYMPGLTVLKPFLGFYPNEGNEGDGLAIDWPEFRLGQKSPSVFLPHWLLLLLTAIPTAWLWHRDRGWRRPGCCLRCGYDLTGNRSGVCSECGEKAKTREEIGESGK